MVQPRSLVPDEVVVLRTRTHGKALVLPGLLLILLAAAAGVGVAAVGRSGAPDRAVPVLQAVVVGAVLLLAGWAVLRPFLRWWGTTYTLTSLRLVLRRGVLNRLAVDVPLNRVLEVASERSLIDRVVGCGTLRLQTAAEGGTVLLHDVPDVDHLHRELAALLFGGARPADRPER